MGVNTQVGFDANTVPAELNDSMIIRMDHVRCKCDLSWKGIVAEEHSHPMHCTRVVDSVMQADSDIPAAMGDWSVQ